MLVTRYLISSILKCTKARTYRLAAVGALGKNEGFEHELLCLRSYCSKNVKEPEKCFKPGQKLIISHDDPPKTGKSWWYLGSAAVLLTSLVLVANSDFVNKPLKVVEICEPKEKKRDRNAIPKNPRRAQDIPTEVPYLLIGGGTASFAAFRAIKSSDPKAAVLIIAEEPFLPYMRPPLSKEMWLTDDREKTQQLIFKQWSGTERSLLYEPEQFYTPVKELMENENGGISVISGYKVVEIDPYCHTVKLDNDLEITYGKALLAPGAKPKELPVFTAALVDPKVREAVTTLRGIWDFDDLQEKFEDAKKIAVVGGGFLGSEIACSLSRLGARRHKKVTQIFKEGGNLAKVLPEYLSRWTTEKVAKEGVTVKPNVEIVSCVWDKNDKMIHLRLSTGELVKVDHVVVCAGVEPDVSLAQTGTLEVDQELGGYLVNTELQARTDLYIAGDAACFYDHLLGRRRVEHHDHAIVTGRLAGENMTGARKPYLHQSMFWSDLGPELGFEAIGDIDSKLPTVGVFVKNKTNEQSDPDSISMACIDHISTDEQKYIENKSGTTREDMAHLKNSGDYNKGVIFYLRNEKIVGMVLWNLFSRISIARQILKEDKTYDDLYEVAKLFEIHQDTLA